MRIAPLLLLVACGDSAPNLPPDASPPDELKGWIPGPRNQAGFLLEFGDPSRPIAERAHAAIAGHVRTTAPALASVTSENPAILTVDKLSQSDRDFSLQVTGPGRGDTDLVLRDATGAEIDRMTFHVRPSDVLDLPRPWGTGDALVLAGEVELMHVTTMTAGVVTAGVGAVQFDLTGSLSPASKADAPWFFAEGDEVFVRVGASGTGTITASAPDATTVVNVSLVSPSALTELVATPPTLTIPRNHEGIVAIDAHVGAAGVYGARCTWTVPQQLRVELKSLYIDGSTITAQGGSIGEAPGFAYGISGQPGAYQPTCTIGSVSTTVTVHIQ